MLKNYDKKCFSNMRLQSILIFFQIQSNQDSANSGNQKFNKMRVICQQIMTKYVVAILSSLQSF